MYTIISGTNRLGSHSEKVALEYKKFLSEKNIDAKILDLKNIAVLEKNSRYDQIEKEIIVPADKFIFIIAEYNGSFPGVLKSMIDISDIKNAWYWKKAVLTGVSTGRAGNLRGMDHLTDILLHMNVIVHPNKLPISLIDKVMDENGVIHSKPTLQAINKQLDEFIKF